MRIQHTSKQVLSFLRTSFVGTKPGRSHRKALEHEEDHEAGPLLSESLLHLRSELEQSLVLFKREHSRAVKVSQRANSLIEQLGLTNHPSRFSTALSRQRRSTMQGISSIATLSQILKVFPNKILATTSSESIISVSTSKSGPPNSYNSSTFSFSCVRQKKRLRRHRSLSGRNGDSSLLSFDWSGLKTHRALRITPQCGISSVRLLLSLTLFRALPDPSPGTQHER